MYCPRAHFAPLDLIDSLGVRARARAVLVYPRADYSLLHLFRRARCFWDYFACEGARGKWIKLSPRSAREGGDSVWEIDLRILGLYELLREFGDGRL